MTATPAQNADDLEAVRSSLVDAGSVGMALWISYLFFLFWLAAAAGAVTDRDLFFDNAVKLPVLNVDLPMVAFFVIAPTLFVVFHLYLLVHFNLLGAKASRFNEVLVSKTREDVSTRRKLRLQLPINVFVQYWAGPSAAYEPGDTQKARRHQRIMITVLWIIIHATMLVAPAILLLIFQFRFLAYHKDWVTWFQSVALTAVLLTSWWFWPRRSQSFWQDNAPGRNRGVKRTLASIGIAFACLVSLTAVPANKEFPPTETLLAPVLTNVLVLPRLDANDRAKHPLSMKGRDLTCAILTSANLQKVDFTTAVLRGADLAKADLTGAILKKAHLEGADLRETTGLSGEGLADAIGDAATQLPEGLARPTAWPAVKPGTSASLKDTPECPSTNMLSPQSRL